MTKKKKRFLFLITHYVPHVYGAELFAQNVAEYLAKEGHRVDLVTGHWNSSWKRQEVINGVSVYRVSVVKIRFIQTLYFILPQFWQAQKLIQRKDYDIIHAHIFPSLVTGALLTSKAKKILTIQGGDLADYPEIYGPAAPILKKIIGLCIRKYHIVHAVSQDLRKQIQKLSNVTAQVIPNGVDSRLLIKNSHVANKRDLFPKTKYVLFSPSRLTNKNNLLETIKAIKLVRDTGLDVGLVIAGEGHQQEVITHLIKEKKLTKQVILLGHVSHKDSLALSSQADSVIRVSSQEGFGISLLEGLAVGTTVIASQAGGLKDFIKPEHAYVVKDPKAKSISDTIVRALSDKNRHKKITRAQELVRQSYTWQKVLEALMKFY